MLKTLQQFADTFGGERPACVCREISKIHEESVRGTLAELVNHFSETEPRGEIVIVVGGDATKKAKEKNNKNKDTHE